MPRPDGRVDPDGPTLHALISGASTAAEAPATVKLKDIATIDVRCRGAPPLAVICGAGSTASPRTRKVMTFRSISSAEWILARRPSAELAVLV